MSGFNYIFLNILLPGQAPVLCGGGEQAGSKDVSVLFILIELKYDN